MESLSPETRIDPATDPIAKPRLTSKITFVGQQRDALFAMVLKERVAAYFNTTKLSKYGDLPAAAKVAFYLGLYFTIYFLMVTQVTSFGAYVLFSMALGLVVAGIGFNVSHDAIHGGLSSKKWLNAILSESFTLIGGNAYNWSTTHNVVHHTYTNINGYDGDLRPLGILRFSKHQPLRPIHRFQHLYVWGLYSLLSLEWATKRDFVQIFKTHYHQYKKPECPLIEKVKLFVGKTLYYVLLWAIPMTLLPVAWWQVLVGFVAMHIVTGLSLALVFQLGHLVEGTMNSPEHESKMPDSFIVHQLKSTSNFCSRGRWANFLTGGLNCQIEHHLFPQICHLHYPKLAVIVRQTAEEFGLPYIEHKTWPAAVRSHYRYLKNLGRPALVNLK